MRRLGWAALVSIAIHAGLLCLLWAVDPVERPVRRVVTSGTKPLAVDIVMTPTPSVPAPGTAGQGPTKAPSMSSGASSPTAPRAAGHRADGPSAVPDEVPTTDDGVDARASVKEEVPAGSATQEGIAGASAPAPGTPSSADDLDGSPSPVGADVPSGGAAPEATANAPVSDAPTPATAEPPTGSTAPDAIANAPDSDAPAPATTDVPSDSAAPDGLAVAPFPNTPPRDASPEAATSPDAPHRHQQPRAGADALPSFLVPGGAPPPGPRAPGGRTLRPGDPTPSREQLAAEERATVTGRVEKFVVDDQAELRVANGLIDPYFSRLRAALEKGLEDAPVFPGTRLLHQARAAWADHAGRFGATGNPGGARSPNAPTMEENLFALQQREGDESMERPRLFAQAGRELQHLATGGGSKLVVTLELVQNVDGSLRDAKLIGRSGNAAYDAFVLDAVPASLAKLPPPPAGARGVRTDGIHTLWAVEGRVVYLRKLRELKGQDAWYIAAASAAGIMAGRFEETTGEIEVIDFRNPRFVCSSHLLRVY